LDFKDPPTAVGGICLESEEASFVGWTLKDPPTAVGGICLESEEASFVGWTLRIRQRQLAVFAGITGGRTLRSINFRVGIRCLLNALI